MDSRQFTEMIRRHAVDEVVEQVVKLLRSPRKPRPMPQTLTPVQHSIKSWADERWQIERRRSEWFNQLRDEDQELVRAILADCAETAVFNLLAVIDGVAGDYGGVFEIVAIDSAERRSVVNPQNTPMLHDVFAAVSEENREDKI